MLTRGRTKNKKYAKSQANQTMLTHGCVYFSKITLYQVSTILLPMSNIIMAISRFPGTNRDIHNRNENESYSDLVPFPALCNNLNL